MFSIAIFLWRWTYELEEARQSHAASRNLWRQAACCIGLALLRILGGR